MKIELKLTSSDPKIVHQLKKKLSSKVELTKEDHIYEALYLSQFLYSIDEIVEANGIISAILDSYENVEDMWAIVMDAYLLKWSLALRDGEEKAADEIQKRVYSAEYDVNFNNSDNDEIHEKYKYHMELLPESLESLEYEKNPWFHCSMLGQEVFDSHRFLFFYKFFKDCAPSNFKQDITLHVDEMYARLATAVRAF